VTIVVTCDAEADTPTGLCLRQQAVGNMSVPEQYQFLTRLGWWLTNGPRGPHHTCPFCRDTKGDSS
jgi:hypothetical protein